MKTSKHFNILFAVVSVILALTVWGTSTVPELHTAMPLVWICFFSFLIVTYIVSLMGLRFIKIGEASKFMGVFFVGIVLKLFLAGTMVLIYRKVLKEESSWIVLPFAIIYFTYLIFETAILVKASGSSNQKSRR